MKTKHYCFAIVLLMAIFPISYAQQTYTLTVKNKENDNENFPRYNLFYLSKLMVDDNLSLEEKNKTFYALKNIINNKSLNKNSIDKKKYKNIYDFIVKYEEDCKKQFETWFDENSTQNFRKFLNASTDKSLLDSLAKIEKLKTDYKSISDTIKKFENLKNNLNEEYYPFEIKDFERKGKINGKYYGYLFNIYYTLIGDKYKIRTLELLKQELNNKYQAEKTEEINNLKEKYTSDELNKLPLNLRPVITDNYYKDEKNDYYFKNLEVLKKELDNKVNISKLISDNKSKEDNLKEEIGNFITDYLKIFSEKRTKVESDNIKKILNADNFRVSKDQKIIINSQIQTAQAQTGTSGISIPSQSQMIEAMAIFLAKRAKQEAAIWFMDQIRLKMNNPMILDVFLETIKVLDGVENYKIPTFNTTWKYAIAKDFVEMPKHLVNSPWVENVIIKNPTNHAMLKQSIEFGYDMNRLMTEQYNYRDIIKYFYINPRTEKDENGKDKTTHEINRLIDNSTTLLYIITNEFFAIETIDEKDVYRLLSYEEISSLSDDEFKILIELINLKYEKRLKDIKNFEKFNLKNKEKLNKWMGNILISLSQFDKIRNGYQTKKEEIKEDLASKNFYNVWSVLNQLTKNLCDENLFGSKTFQNVKEKMEWVQKGMSVYEHFQSNDYVGAANQTFDLVNMIKQNSTSSQEPKEYFYEFDGRKKISIALHLPNLSFVLKQVNQTKEQNYVSISFVNKDSLSFKTNSSLKPINISIKDFDKYLNFVKYTTKSKNDGRKLLEVLLDEDKNKDFLISVSDILGIDRSQLIQLTGYIQIVNTANSIEKKNIDELFTEMNFSYVKDKSLNIINQYNDKYTKQLTNLLSFFGDVLTVKDEQQLAGVIDSYALPPTSYKLKRKQPHSIDLNAYVGAFGGMLSSFKSSLLDSQFVYGITAPIGVAFTWSNNANVFDNLGFTIDVVDLGNVVNHYLIKPNEDYPKDVHFSEVFSLGSTFLLGIKNSPFVVSGGFRLQPFNTGKDQNNKVFDAGIFHVGLKIDIPLIHLSGKDF